MKISCISLHAATGTPLYHVGPPLDYGPLPSIFYFALSGPDSLTLDPYNQPVRFLQGKMVRLFSMDLPAHENQLPAVDAMKTWAEEYARGIDSLSPFFEKALKAIEFTIQEKFADPGKLAAMGLSRGGFVASHVAALEKRVQAIALFAPLTKLQFVKEFFPLQENPKVLALDVDHLTESLYDRKIRFFIGNRDTRVSTRSCFDFAMALVEKAHEKNQRSSFVELVISPSIGHMGHGTSPEVFKQGADWLLQTLKI